MKMIVASSLDRLTDRLRNEGINVVCSTDSFPELQRIFGSSEAIGDTLLISEKINQEGSIIAGLIKIHEDFPELRIIFLASGTLDDPFTVNRLHALASHGIYDLYYGGTITIEGIVSLVRNPKTKAECNDIFIQYAKNKIPEAVARGEDQTETSIMLDRTIRNNVVGVTSVKPGTGKSIVASNLAVTLAKYGKIQGEDRAPKILLLEGDLQTLSVSTFFGIKDEEYNLKNALFQIQEYFENNNYDYKRWYEGASDVKAFVKRCCRRTNVENLFVLEGHDFNITDIELVSSASFFYLVNYLSTQYDEIVIDCNSSLQHPTTDAILQICKNLYYVYTTEFNNLKLNLRYIDEFKNLGISNKVKYVLNKALVGEQKDSYSFEYSDKELVSGRINIDFEIPLVDMAVILNSTYRHVQLCSDNTAKTLPVRIAFLELANSVMPLKAPEEIENEIEELKKHYKGKKKKGLF